MEFTPDAQAMWDRIADEVREKILESGFCSRCLASRRFTVERGEMRGGELTLIGKCATCGARVVRMLQP
jgi:hypothetical protein